MVSGIGPKQELKNHNIKQVLDLPIGQNLQDHPIVPLFVRVGKPDGQMTMNALDFLNPLNMLEFYSSGTGPFASNSMGVVGVMHTSRNKKQKRPGNYSDFQSHSKLLTNR